MKGPPLRGVPTVPNASLVTGIVQKIKEHPATILEVLVHRAEDIDDLANFCADEIGNTIQITLRGREAKPLPAPRQYIRLRVEFRGHAWGSGYYANTKDIQMLDHTNLSELESEDDD